MDTPVESSAERLQQATNQPIRLPKELLSTFIILFGLCGQITFTVIPVIEEEKHGPSNRDFSKIRTLLSISWLFFSISCGLCSTLALYQHYLSGGGRAQRQQQKHRSAQVVVFAMVEVTACLAFLFLCLVLLEYTSPVGWIALGLISLVALVSMICFTICH